jgi:hypothetical protein
MELVIQRIELFAKHLRKFLERLLFVFMSPYLLLTSEKASVVNAWCSYLSIQM